jgi:alkylated DNA repair dioxygenase AlkB
MYDRFVDVPREQAWFGDDRERAFTPLLERVRRELEALTSVSFSYVLLNRYRDGRDSVAWHGDHDGTGDPRKVVASLSLGATREFDLRPKRESGLRPRTIAVDVGHGDLIVMAGATQRNWEHRVRKDPCVHDERINLTFRQHRAR